MGFRIIKNTGSYYKKMLLTFTASISALVIILSSILSWYFSNSAMGILRSSNIKTLSQISYSLNYMDDMSRRFCNSVILNNMMISFMYRKTDDLQSSILTEHTLKNLTIPNSYIHSLFAYNRHLDTYLTSEDGIYKSNDFYDQEIAKLVKQKSKSGAYEQAIIPRKAANPAAYGEKASSFTNVYTYILFDQNNSSKSADGAIVLNVNTDWLRNIISSLSDKSAYEGTKIFVIDDKGTIVSHPSQQMFLKNVSNDGYIKKILSSKGNTGFFTNIINNEKYSISYVYSPILKWKFVSITPYRYIASTVDRIMLFSILLSFSILIIGICFSFITSNRIYAPIGKLTNNIRNISDLEGGGGAINEDEVAFLSSAFQDIFSKARELEKQKIKNMTTLKNNFIKNVISGNVFINEEEVASELKDLDIDFSFEGRLFLALLKIDHYNHFIKDNNERTRIVFKNAIMNASNKILSEHFKNIVIDMGSDHFVLLSNIDELTNQEEIHDIFKDIIFRIQEYVKENLHISLSGTIGVSIDNPEVITNAYNRTLNASMYRIIYGHSSILTTDILEQIDYDSYKIPATKEKILLDSLKLGNLEKAKECYKDILFEVSTRSYDNIMTSILYLMFTIYNKLNSNLENFSENYSVLFNGFFTSIGEFETLDDIYVLFCTLFEEITSKQNKAKNRKSDIKVSNIIKIIEENYADKNLCLNTIADALNMSSVYVGRIFKEATNKSVAEYIMDKRMEKLRGLLDTTNLTTNIIIEKVGLEKNNYFYTMFKKYFGVSIGDYRLDLKTKNSNLSE